MGGAVKGMGGAMDHPINMAATAAGIAGVPFTGGASLALPAATSALSGYNAGGVEGALGGGALGAGAGLGGSALMGNLAPSALGGMLGMASPTSSLAGGYNPAALASGPVSAWNGSTQAMQAAPTQQGFFSGMSSASSMLDPASKLMGGIMPGSNNSAVSQYPGMAPAPTFDPENFLTSNSNLTGRT